MTLSGSVNAATSGLRTTQTLSRIAADNVANAMTPGYVKRRAILVTPGTDVSGAAVGEIRREVNASLQRMAPCFTICCPPIWSAGDGTK